MVLCFEVLNVRGCGVNTLGFLVLRSFGFCCDILIIWWCEIVEFWCCGVVELWSYSV